MPESTNFIEPAVTSNRPIYIIQSQCRPNFTLSVPVGIASTSLQLGIDILTLLIMILMAFTQFNTSQLLRLGMPRHVY